ncbi:MAG TPA: hypothetical protein VME66_06280 [Candidatus Acidoferrales bacterium]|nr:hypothetical protein [Candidatus Acidoferrales bacterium]
MRTLKSELFGLLRRLFGVPTPPAERPPLSTLITIAAQLAPATTHVAGAWSYTTLAMSAGPPLPELLRARRWSEAARIHTFDPTADNIVAYLVCKGTTPIAVTVFLDPYELFRWPELLQPAILLDDAERREIASLSLPPGESIPTSGRGL